MKMLTAPHGKSSMRKSTTVDEVPSQYCMGSPDQIMTWGRPIAVFGWDNAKDVDIKNFSVREVQNIQ
jgi:hypothetical protein